MPLSLPLEMMALVDREIGRGGTVRAIAARTGVSKSLIQRRATEVVIQERLQICTPERAAEGDDPLPVGHPLSWGAIGPLPYETPSRQQPRG
jgi:hypothetical protein